SLSSGDQTGDRCPTCRRPLQCRPRLVKRCKSSRVGFRSMRVPRWPAGRASASTSATRSAYCTRAPSQARERAAPPPARRRAPHWPTGSTRTQHEAAPADAGVSRQEGAAMPRYIKVAAAQMGPNNEGTPREAIVERMLGLLEAAERDGVELIAY